MGVFNNKEKTEFEIGDKLFYYYKYPMQEPYNGEYGVVTFIVKEIHIEKTITENGTRKSEKYEGGKFGTNYYGIASSFMVSKTMSGLTEKLLSCGYSFDAVGER